MALTLPIVDVLPLELFDSPWAHQLFAALCLAGTFLLTGMLAGTAIARRFGSWIERNLLQRFPPYSVIRTLADRLSGSDAPTQLQPALLSVSPEVQTLVAIVEEFADGRLTVFVPLAPTTAVGHLLIVAPGRVERLDVSMASALGWVMNWGTGTEELLGGSVPRRTE